MQFPVKMLICLFSLNAASRVLASGSLLMNYLNLLISTTSTLKVGNCTFAEARVKLERNLRSYSRPYKFGSAEVARYKYEMPIIKCIVNYF